MSLSFENVLSISNVEKFYGGLKALNKVNFEIKSGELIGLIGPNGAGKTTLFNLITGLEKTTSGEIFFFNENITSLKPYQIASKGISRTFQNLRLFFDMTVLENVMIGCYYKTASNLIKTILRDSEFKKNEKMAVQKAVEQIKFVGMMEKANELTKNLSYGEQRYVELARALVSEPKLILLDEPSAGMNPTESKKLMQLILKIKENGINIIIIEHDMRVIMSICERIIVLDQGKVIACGNPQEIKNHPKVISAYLGNENIL